MDANAGIGRLDCYEDMFKEITRKLYGEDPDHHRTSNVQNEFETASSEFKQYKSEYKGEEDPDNGSDDGSWTIDDEPLKGTDGTRIAAYRPSTSTWRCYECGETMGGGPRDMAEHFMNQHASRLMSGSPPRNLTPQLEEIAAHLARFRDRAERTAPPPRRTQMTQTIPAALMPVVTSSFLQLQDLPAALAPTAHLIQSPGASLTTISTPTSVPTAAPSSRSSGSKRSSSSEHQDSPPGSGTKRYKCTSCAYSTDRRDLYTRHENIHREEKPFHCYICFKPFSRADHVKKHFLRMHKEHNYELARIRSFKHPSTTQPTESNNNNNNNNNNSNNNNNNSRCSSNASSYPSSLYSAPTKTEPQAQPQPQAQPAPPEPTATTYHLQAPPSTSSVRALYEATAGMSPVVLAAAVMQQQHQQLQQQQQQQQHQHQQQPPEPAALTPLVQNSSRRLHNTSSKSGGSSKSNSSSGNSSSSAKVQERRYTCCYCSWSGVDNWCLKRHLNTHTKPYACALCEYKAARAERLATHVLKVHNRRQCSRCSFVVDDLAQLQLHQLHVHRISHPTASLVGAATAVGNNPSQTNNGPSNALHSVGSSSGGRAPPGPPVFPAPSAAIAPATTVIPPTTMLGEIAATPMDWDRNRIDYWQRSSLSSGENHSESGRSSRCSTSSGGLYVDDRSTTSSTDYWPIVLPPGTELIRLGPSKEEPQTTTSRRKQKQPRKCVLEEEEAAAAAVAAVAAVSKATTIQISKTVNVDPVKDTVSVTTTSPTTAVKKVPKLFRCMLCPIDASSRRYPIFTRRTLLKHKLVKHSKCKYRKNIGNKENIKAKDKKTKKDKDDKKPGKKTSITVNAIVQASSVTKDSSKSSRVLRSSTKVI